MGGQVVSTSSNDGRLISRGHSAVGVGDQGGDMEGTCITITIASSMVVGSTGVDTSNNTMGSQVVSTSSNDGRLISRGHSTVGVGDQGGEMEGTSIAIGNRVSQRSSNRGNNRGSNMGSSHNRGSSSITISSAIGSKLGGQVISTGCCN